MVMGGRAFPLIVAPGDRTRSCLMKRATQSAPTPRELPNGWEKTTQKYSYHGLCEQREQLFRQRLLNGVKRRSKDVLGQSPTGANANP